MLGKIQYIKVLEYVEMRMALTCGYEIKTTKHTFVVLIDNEQSGSEIWGCMQSDDNLDYFKGTELLEVKLTDVALNEVMVEKSDYYGGGEGGGIQFVDFITDKGIFQLAVYNSHNGYYGHRIFIAKDKEVSFVGIL